MRMVSGKGFSRWWYMSGGIRMGLALLVVVGEHGGVLGTDSDYSGL